MKKKIILFILVIEALTMNAQSFQFKLNQTTNFFLNKNAIN